MVNEILKSYDESNELYNSLLSDVEKLIQKLIKEEKIIIHTISSRIKTRKSLEKKLNKNKQRFKDILDLTDVCGSRIITYFEDEVDRVAEIIKDEFVIDDENSVDKRYLIDVDRFGYMSFHYVVTLPENHWLLDNNPMYAGIKVEIQIRSILQHAWAEIEHDLGYKSKTIIPMTIRRKFSRLSGILELADLEFNRIKTDLSDYEKAVSESLDDEPESVYIDKSTLMQYLKNSQRLERLEVDLLSELRKNDEGKSRQFYEDRIPALVDILLYHRIMVIHALDSALKANKKAIVYFGKKMLAQHDISYWGMKPPVGISIMLLGFVLTASTLKHGKVVHFLEKFQISTSDEHDEFAQELIDWYKEISK